MLWHITKIYSAHGVLEFVIYLCYNGYATKNYFANYFLRMSDVTFDLGQNRMDVHNNSTEPWCVTLVETSEATMTGGRLRRVEPHLRGKAAFCFTYGDGVGNIDVAETLRFHAFHGRLTTITAARPLQRAGYRRRRRAPIAGKAGPRRRLDQRRFC